MLRKLVFTFAFLACFSSAFAGNGFFTPEDKCIGKCININGYAYYDFCLNICTQ